MRKIKLIVIIILITSILYGFYETDLLIIKKIKYYNKDIPEKFNNFKIAFVSDIHYGPIFSIKKVRKVIEKTNSLKPDIIILGGDYVYYYYYAAKGKHIAVEIFNELKNLKAKYGVFGVLGNHDHYSDDHIKRNFSIEMMKKNNIISLNNTSVWIKKGNYKIKLGGVDDLWRGNQKLFRTINDVKKNDFVILVSHNPDYAEQIYTNKVDLILSGHTHGGQVTFFGLFAIKLNSNYGQKYIGGIVKNKYQTVIVTKGVGNAVIPFRFFATPEIVEIILKNKSGIKVNKYLNKQNNLDK